MVEEKAIVKRPSIWRFLSEWYRPLGDRIKLRSFLKAPKDASQGGGHKVLVIPGFMASPLSTSTLRSYLDQLGYESIDWGLGRNLARLEQADQLSDLIIQHTKDEPMTVIGWSLGGLYARKLAAEHPDKVRKVITLASPYRDVDAPNNASWLFGLFQRMRGQSKDNRPSWVADLAKPVSIPSVAFYTKEDGIVPWQSCCDFEDPTDHKNIEVYTSHNALGVNQYVIEKITEELP